MENNQKTLEKIITDCVSYGLTQLGEGIKDLSLFCDTSEELKLQINNKILHDALNDIVAGKDNPCHIAKQAIAKLIK